MANNLAKIMVTDGEDERDVIEKVKKLGYRVRKPGHYAKSSFLVQENTLLKFKQVAQELDYQMQEAATEAFDLWVESKAEELAELAKKRGGGK